ncbi:MAG: hypothetical protein R3B72_39050 [Polyangiaceae bacterium]
MDQLGSVLKVGIRAEAVAASSTEVASSPTTSSKVITLAFLAAEHFAGSNTWYDQFIRGPRAGFWTTPVQIELRAEHDQRTVARP